jgi:ABC-type sugar transport system ATPase subunit
MEKNILEVRGLAKNYPGVAALKGIDLDIRHNTVHCIVGENGAGKSTFIKILTCAETRSSGEILFNGKEFKPRSIREAMDLGISTLFQELNVVNQLTVEENLILGREPNRYGVIQRSDPSGKVFQLMKEFASDISLKKKVAQLSFAEKQVIEIVKAIAVDASLLIMDEPTAAVSENETKRLFAIIRSLKKKILQ